MSEVHPTAARGFDAVPDLYERARPGYPEAAVDFLIDAARIGRSDLVLDLGAGTGKFTRELVARSLRCIAVEPVEGMRRVFTASTPGVASIAATAEALPVRDGSADAVLAAQAFHWFATDAAVAEIARVIRPGGHFALTWNARDDSVPWVAAVTEIFSRYEGADGIRIPRHRERRWRAPLERASLFEQVASREFPNAQSLTRDMLKDRLASVSFIAVLPDDQRARALADLQHVIDSDPDLDGRDIVEHPYITEVYVFRRVLSRRSS